jgi:hypothetical protein
MHIQMDLLAAITTYALKEDCFLNQTETCSANIARVEVY